MSYSDAPISSQTSFPNLPNELFIEIVRHFSERIRDTTFLWTSCRGVSRAFKAAVEHVFIQKHLPKTSLHVSAGILIFSAPEALLIFLLRYVGRRTFRFNFSHLDSNKEAIAIFQPVERREACKIKGKHKIQNDAFCPPIAIQIHDEVNDTFIPQLYFDSDTLQFRCNFTGMFSEWFRERKEYDKRREKAVSVLL